MTTPDGLPRAGTVEAASEHDPDAAEAYAESVSTEPSHDEINEYLKMAGAAPLADQPDAGQADDVGA